MAFGRAADRQPRPAHRHRRPRRPHRRLRPLRARAAPRIDRRAPESPPRGGAGSQPRHHHREPEPLKGRPCQRTTPASGPSTRRTRAMSWPWTITTASADSTGDPGSVPNRHWPSSTCRTPRSGPSSAANPASTSGRDRRSSTATTVSRSASADGTRDLELVFTEAIEEDGALTFVFTDRHYPLEVRTRYRSPPRFRRHRTHPRPAQQRHRADRGRPRGLGDLGRARTRHPAPEPAPRRVGRRNPAHAHHDSVRRDRDRLPARHHEPPGEPVGRRRRRRGHRDLGRGLVDRAGLERHLAHHRREGTTGRVVVSAGFGHDPIAIRLRGGETLETPVAAGLHTAGGFAAAASAWHDYALAHVLPHPDEVRPVLYNSWEATEFDFTAEDQMRLADRAAAHGLRAVRDGRRLVRRPRQRPRRASATGPRTPTGSRTAWGP